jgi:hypothetical protein
MSGHVIKVKHAQWQTALVVEKRYTSFFAAIQIEANNTPYFLTMYEAKSFAILIEKGNIA